ESAVDTFARRSSAKVARAAGIHPVRAASLLGGALLLSETSRLLDRPLELARGGVREGAALALAEVQARAAAASRRPAARPGGVVYARARRARSWARRIIASWCACVFFALASRRVHSLSEPSSQVFVVSANALSRIAPISAFARAFSTGVSTSIRRSRLRGIRSALPM